MTPYHFSVTLHGDFDAIVAKTRESLAGEGFGVLSEIDVASTLRAKIGAELPRYLILGACNPPFAKQAIDHDPAIGTLLPCNVVVREGADCVIVDFMDPAAILALVDNPGIAKVADEVRTKLEMVRDSLATH